MVTSFISEHSVEYCIVPQMTKILEERFTVIPLYFWSTREGSRLARKCTLDEQIRLLVLFARRPKLVHPGDDIITMKVNTELQQMATDSQRDGIPVFCGLPLVSSIFDFRLSSPCFWFKIASQTDALEDIDIEISIQSRDIVQSNEVVLMQSQEDILEYAETASPYGWPQVISLIKDLRCSCVKKDSSKFLLFSRYYKPVYFFLLDRMER